MAEEELPDGVDVDRARPRVGDVPTWARRVVLAGIALLVVLGLLNTFGQDPTVSQAQSASATLRVSAPADLRGGLIFQVRVDITAHRRLAKPMLVFSPGWFDSMTTNAIAPQPTTQVNIDGSPGFQLSPMPAGRLATYWFYFQVNPTNIGWQRPETLDLLNGTTLVASIHRTITIYP